MNLKFAFAVNKENQFDKRYFGDAIIKLLKGKDVNVLVSMQFGKNIKMVNEYFIPVIIYSETPEDTVNILNKHLHWIKDEWGKNK